MKCDQICIFFFSPHFIKVTMLLLWGMKTVGPQSLWKLSLTKYDGIRDMLLQLLKKDLRKQKRTFTEEYEGFYMPQCIYA